MNRVLTRSIVHSASATTQATTALGSRFVTTTAGLRAKQLPPRPTLNEHDLDEKFVKGSGPGGQAINKTSSAVQLVHTPSGLSVKCQDTRSREQNRKIARRWLAEKLDEVEKGPESRNVLKAAVAAKKKASKTKKSRRKYRRLDEEKRAAAEGASTQVDGDADQLDEVQSVEEEEVAKDMVSDQMPGYGSNNESKRGAGRANNVD